MIAIKSNKDLTFFSHTGRVTTEIDLYQNKPAEGTYVIRLKDTCSTEEEVEVPVMGEEYTETVTKVTRVGVPTERFEEMTYAELSEMAENIDIDFSNRSNLIENIAELFRQGLLIKTQLRCTSGFGIYGSSAEDWEILRI